MSVARVLKRTPVRVALLLLLGAAIYAGYRAWALRRVHGFIVALAAVDSERAVVCVRANDDRYENGARAWVGLLDAHGSWAWSQKLDGTPIVGPHDGLLVHDAHVVVRTALPSGVGKTASYSLADGHREWTRDFDTAQSATYVDMVPAGPRVVQGGVDALTAIDAASGTIAWKIPTNAFVSSARVAGPSLLWSEDLNGASASLDGGAKRTITSTGSGMCVVGSELVYMMGDRVEARAVDGNGGQRTVASLALPEGVSRVYASQCGIWKTHPLFMVSFSDGTSAPMKPGLVEIDVASGTQVRFDPIDLHPLLSVVQQSNDAMFPENGSLAGDIARFVPMIDGDSNGFALVVLDVEARKITRKGPVSHARLFTEIVGDHGVFYLQGGGAGDDKELVRFDGATGKITAAVRLPDVESLRPPALAQGRIWVHSSRWTEPLPWALLDGTTLVPVHSQGMRITPASDEIAKAWLGGP